jgi:hypothetical protein
MEGSDFLGMNALEAVSAWFREWIGWGWGLTFFVWVAGSVYILTVVYRECMERFHSRLPTAVILVVWTLVVLGTAGKYLGYGPPGGK